MDYQDFKRKQILLELQKNLLSITSFNEIAIDNFKTFNSRINDSYSINDNKSPLTNLQKELEELQNNIKTKILVNLDNELKK